MGGETEFDFGHAEFPVPRGIKQTFESKNLWPKVDFGARVSCVAICTE